MNATTKFTLTLIAFGLVSNSHAGDMTGTVTLKGTPPPERTVDLKTESALAAKHPKGLTTRHYQVGPNSGLQHVLVFVRGSLADTTFEPPRTSPVLDHADGLFQPYVLGIRVGQPLQLKCSDGTTCSFHTAPKANQSFAIAPFRDTVPRTFTEPEVPVRFKCDLHPWNYAYVGVFSHPFFAVTDELGRYTIPGVPLGNYTVEVFHPKTGTTSKPVVVADKATKVDFEVTAK